jgi:hypothetical protein
LGFFDFFGRLESNKRRRKHSELARNKALLLVTLPIANS